jgi:hypothetical protein
VWIDEGWVTSRVAVAHCDDRESVAVARLRGLVTRWAIAFADRRLDVRSPVLTWPRRGLLDDEAGSFLRAMNKGLVEVD